MTYLDDFLVRHACEEYVLLVFIGMELDDVGYFAVAETLYALSSLRIPQLHLAIIAAGQKASTVV